MLLPDNKNCHLRRVLFFLDSLFSQVLHFNEILYVIIQWIPLVQHTVYKTNGKQQDKTKTEWS